jgi:ABC-type Fe3+ transport system permease subunit
VLGVLLLLLYNRLIKRADSFVTMTGKGYRQRRAARRLAISALPC